MKAFVHVVPPTVVTIESANAYLRAIGQNLILAPAISGRGELTVFIENEDSFEFLGISKSSTPAEFIAPHVELGEFFLLRELVYREHKEIRVLTFES